MVITTYNRPDYLEHALSSVLLQDKMPSQIIVVDDCSENKYWQAVQQVIAAAQLEFLECKRLTQKMGANAARNKGIEHATGDLIAFLDDDDYWHSNFLRQHIKCYQSQPNISGVLCGKRIMGTTENVINTDPLVTQASLRLGNRYCGMSGVSIKRQVLLQHNFDETLTNGQDWDLFVRLVCAQEQLANISEALYDYRKNTPQSISTVTKTHTIDKSDSRLASAYKHKEWLGEYYFKRRVADQLLTFLQHKPDKTKWLLKSIKMAGVVITLSTLFSKLIR